MKRTYEFLLILYPRAHRDRFSEEMKQVFEAAAGERREQGRASYFGFVSSEMLGLIGDAARAWVTPQRAAQLAAAKYRHLPLELAQAQQRVDDTIAGMVLAIANHQFEKARNFSNLEREARANLHTAREKYGIDDSPEQFQCS
jgi:hypothetical protein